MIEISHVMWELREALTWQRAADKWFYDKMLWGMGFRNKAQNSVNLDHFMIIHVYNELVRAIWIDGHGKGNRLEGRTAWRPA